MTLYALTELGWSIYREIEYLTGLILLFAAKCSQAKDYYCCYNYYANNIMVLCCTRKITKMGIEAKYKLESAINQLCHVRFVLKSLKI